MPITIFFSCRVDLNHKFVPKDDFSEQEETSLYIALNETIDVSLENVEWTEPLSWQK